MASKRGKLEQIGEPRAKSLGNAVLKMLGIGLAGGILLIAGANKAGEKIEDYTAKHAAKEEPDFDIPLEEIEHYTNEEENL